MTTAQLAPPRPIRPGDVLLVPEDLEDLEHRVAELERVVRELDAMRHGDVAETPKDGSYA